MTKSVSSFLSHLRNVLSKPLVKSSSLRVVCGNQSADFDSVVSALAYAYCSYQRDPEDLFIPIISIPRHELSFRRDIARALVRANLQLDQLFFLEDLKQLKEKYGSLKVVLVDHNQLEPGVESYLEQVIGVIDHHKDAQLYPEAEPRIIRTAGSCSSLVINYWRKLLTDSNLTKDVASLCLGAAVIDTSNFTQRVEDPDLEAAQFYHTLLPELDSVSLYKQIRHDKDDLDGLSIGEILTKDYKQFEFKAPSNDKSLGILRVGIASAIKPLSWFYQTYNGEKNFYRECCKVQRQKNVDVMIVMTAWMNGTQFERELAIISQSHEVCQKIIKSVSEKLKLEKKDLTALKEEDTAFFKVFQQWNVSASRKQVAPYVKDAVEES